MMKKVFAVAATAALALVVMNASPVVKMNSGLGVYSGRAGACCRSPAAAAAARRGACRQGEGALHWQG